jgi:uncharacterized phiE125 gp8 family phage protein
MNWNWVVTTPPASEPVSLADMKDHLKVDVSDDDALITIQIVAARKWMEFYCNRSIPSQTLTAKLDSFPIGDQSFIVPQSPVISIASIKYIDTEGVIQTLNSSLYTVDTDSVPARIEPAYGESWPSIRTQHNAITIEYVAGQSTVDDDIIQALKLLVGSLYLLRENDCPLQSHQPSFNVKSLLAHHRLFYRGPW